MIKKIIGLLKSPLFYLILGFLSLCLLGYYLDSVLEPLYEDHIADCPDCLNNTTLKEFCNTSNKSPECTHYGWCVTLKNIEGSAKT